MDTPTLRERIANDYPLAVPTAACRLCGRPFDARSSRHRTCTPCRDAQDAETKRRRQAWAAVVRQPVKYNQVGGVSVPVTCGCGCGEAINADTIEILKMRQLGATYTAIAVRLETSTAAVKQRLRSMPRFVRGHIVREQRIWAWHACERCGKPVYRPSSTRHPHCPGICIDVEAFFEHNYRIFDQRRAELNAAARQNADHAGVLTAEHRRLVRLARQRAIRTGSREHWESVGLLSEEVQALMDEQRRDQRLNQVQYDVSLDVRLDAKDDGSHRLARVGGVCFDRDDDRWPYFAERGRRPRKSRAA